MAWIAETYLGLLSEYVSPHGLERYFGVLMHIVEHSGTITPKELGRFMRRDKVTIMRIVNHLCERGFVQRRQNPDDKRSQLLAATANGKKLVPVILEGYKKTNAFFFKDFDKNEEQAFRSGLKKLMQIVEELPESDFIIRAEKRKK